MLFLSGKIIWYYQGSYWFLQLLPEEGRDGSPPGLPSVSQWGEVSLKSSEEKRLLWAAVCCSVIPCVWKTESILVGFPLLDSSTPTPMPLNKWGSTCWRCPTDHITLILKSGSQADQNQKVSLVALLIVTAFLLLLLRGCPIPLGGEKSLRLVLEEEKFPWLLLLGNPLAPGAIITWCWQ